MPLLPEQPNIAEQQAQELEQKMQVDENSEQEVIMT